MGGEVWRRAQDMGGTTGGEGSNGQQRITRKSLCGRIASENAGRRQKDFADTNAELIESS